MVTATDSLKGFIENKNEPAELRDVRLAALSAYEKAPLPGIDGGDTIRESWRKIDLVNSGFDPRAYRLADTPTNLEIQNPDEQRIIAKPFGTVLSSQDANDQKLAEKLRAHLAAALKEVQAADRPDAGLFAAQNLATHAQNVAVYSNGAGNEAVHIKHRMAGDAGRGALVHRTFIAAADNAELTVIEEFTGTDSEELQLWNCETHVICGNNARVNYVALHNYQGPEQHFHRFVTEQSRDSRVHYSTARQGGIKGKAFVIAKAREPGAEFRGIGLLAASGREFSDMEMLAEHHADHTTSSLLYKTVVKDRAHSVFNGNLLIPPGRKHVDSLQTNNNILLNQKARAESMPRLVVRSEDVAAEHGATVGELDADAVFFLMARGIPEADARALLIQGFLNEVIAEIPAPEYHESILDTWRSKLAI